MKRSALWPTLVCPLLLVNAVSASELVDLNIESMPVGAAMKIFGLRAEVNVIFRSSQIPAGVTSRPVRGPYAPEDALKQMLEGTGLRYERVNSTTFTVTVDPAPAAEASGPAPDADEARTDPEKILSPWRTSNAQRMPQILIRTDRSLNNDIERSEDDVQPYVVFDRKALRASGDRSASEFLRRNLPMNVVSAQSLQQQSLMGGGAPIDIHGLGSAQTLVLIDGRRVTGSSAGGPIVQPDINGIPLSVIERIEVLPATASGIYGGGATGGVINIVLRRDYSGGETSFQYEDVTGSDANARQIHFSYGWQGDSTSLMLFGANSDQGALLNGERDFLGRGRSTILDNNPNAFMRSAKVPLGSSPNIRSASGRPLPGLGTASITHVPPGYISSMGVDPLIQNAGTYNLEAADSAQAGGGKEAALVSHSAQRSGEALLSQEFPTGALLFAHMAAAQGRARSRRNVWDYGNQLNVFVSAQAENNPFDEDIVVSVPMVDGDGIFISETKSRRVALGASFPLAGEWKLGLDLTAGLTSLEFSGPQSKDISESLAAGTPDVLRDTRQFPLDVREFWRDWKTSPLRTTTREVNILAAGPAMSLPAGKVVVTTSLQQRTESHDGLKEWTNDGPGTEFEQVSARGPQEMTVKSAYGEARVPIVSRLNARRGLRELELQVSGRFDDYSLGSEPAAMVFGNSVSGGSTHSDFSSWNGVVGLRYKPVDDVMIRMSYSTGFQPPSLSESGATISTVLPARSLVDGRRGNELTDAVEVVGGGNPHLRPERSRSTSVGFVFTPGFAPGLRISLDGLRIEKVDNIYPVDDLIFDDLLRYEGMFPGNVERWPLVPGDTHQVGKIKSITGTLVNAAHMKVTTVDGNFSYRTAVPRLGELEVTSRVTWVVDYQVQPTPFSPLRDYVGVTSERPQEFGGVLSLILRNGPVSFGVESRYSDSYLVSEDIEVQLNQGAREVGGQLLHDVFAEYEIAPGSLFPKALSVRVGVRNVLNTAARFDASAGDSSYYSAADDPRMAAYYCLVRAGF